MRNEASWSKGHLLLLIKRMCRSLQDEKSLLNREMQDARMNNIGMNRPTESFVKPCGVMLVLIIGNMLSYAGKIPVTVKLRAASNAITSQFYPSNVYLTVPARTTKLP